MSDSERQSTPEEFAAATEVAEAANDFRRAFAENLAGAKNINLPAVLINLLQRFEIAQMQLTAVCTELVESGVISDLKSGERFAKTLRSAAAELRKPRIALDVGNALKNGSHKR